MLMSGSHQDDGVGRKQHQPAATFTFAVRYVSLSVKFNCDRVVTAVFVTHHNFLFISFVLAFALASVFRIAWPE